MVRVHTHTREGGVSSRTPRRLGLPARRLIAVRTANHANLASVAPPPPPVSRPTFYKFDGQITVRKPGLWGLWPRDERGYPARLPSPTSRVKGCAARMRSMRDTVAAAGAGLANSRSVRAAAAVAAAGGLSESSAWGVPAEASRAPGRRGEGITGKFHECFASIQRLCLRCVAGTYAYIF